MRTRVILTVALMVTSMFLVPLSAQAIMYAPGETLNPACGPTEPNCGVSSATGSGTVGTGVAGQVPYYAVNGDVLTPSSAFTVLSNGNVGIGTASPAAKLDITEPNFSAVTGSEMIIAVADRNFSSNTGKWTGTSWVIGPLVATHTAGATALTLDNTALSSAPASGKIYQITFTTNTTVAGTITPSIGNVDGIAVGQATGANTQFQLISATGAGALTFTPDANWTGTLDNISVQEITPSLASLILRDSNGLTGLEIRDGGDHANTFIGKSVGQVNSTNNFNTGVGFSALSYNLGVKNTAVGSGALQNNTSGSNNTALGFNAFFSNTTGKDSVAVGLSALLHNTIGINNTAVGRSALQANTVGASNTALGGINALLSNTTGSSNTAIGTGSGQSVTTGSSNVLFGASTIAASINQITTGSNNISIGTNVAVASSTASNQLDIGNLIYGTGLSGTGLTVSPGNIGIGTTSPGQKLDVTGTIRQTGCINGALSANASGDIICTSDANLKQNITPFTSGLDIIDGISPQYFQYDGETFTHAGFIAQNVQSVLPQATPFQTNGYLGLDTNAILAASVNAIKELANQVGGFAQSITTRVLNAETGNFSHVKTQDICVGSTCVSETELKAILNQSGQQPAY